ncbi:methyltransferase domain-containing protein [Limnofasciculus baicalensis]|uniref:Class I SAM-dependent methyltransferase n=1 Tax=Limnofasciculus baicalensis BBK-W-15 TaxID=2699891 RepID=A0AAE3KPU1_9CYAN|nr:methyltransferase domain-containing protein [Limnofasciculus baicalensis]MCP2730018.1 class I SAM-dependent methyltransferase [Limnofasciculus baicalensis BBK-W-15]
MLKFQTNFRYKERPDKAKYVWLKYQSILKGSKILDVGADQCYLKQHLDENASYWGIGLGGNPDQQVNLEKEKIPLPDNSFDCVLCLDVLEHLDTLHQTFDELCRVTRRYAIISLHSPYADFWNTLRLGEYRVGVPMKFYGIPLEPPEDRHKWFFSNEEAERFILYRAAKNDMRIVQMDNESIAAEERGVRGLLRVLARVILLRRDFNTKNLYANTLWTVLEKQS